MTAGTAARRRPRRRAGTVDASWRVLAALVVCLGVLLGGGTPAPALTAPPAPDLAVTPPADWPALEDAEAAAYVLIEAASGQQLAAANAERRRPVASTIKVLTAVTALQRVDLDERVTVGDEVVGVEGARVGLEPGDTWTVEELVDAIIVRSGNEAAYALAVHVAGSIDGFVELMRQDAAELGLGGATIVDPTGLRDGNRLSAADLATLARAALADPVLRPMLARQRVILPSEGAVTTRNELLERYPGATGVKTGFTMAAGNSLVGSAVRDGRELIAVVLGAGDDPARFELAAYLLDLGFDRFRPVNLEAALELAVGGGQVDVVVPALTLTVPDDAVAVLDVPLPVRPPDLPVEVDVTVGDRTLGRVPATVRLQRPPATEPGAVLGRAAADGAYAALRAAAGTGSLR